MTFDKESDDDATIIDPRDTGFRTARTISSQRKNGDTWVKSKNYQCVRTSRRTGEIKLRIAARELPESVATRRTS